MEKHPDIEMATPSGERLKSTLELLDWNTSQEPCNFSLNVLHQLSVLSLQLSLQSGEQKNQVLGQVVGNDKGLVARGIVVWSLKMSRPDAHNPVFQSSEHFQVKGCVDSRPCCTNSKRKIPQTSKNTISIAFIRDLLMHALLGLEEDCVYHSELCLLDSGSYSNIQDWSPVRV
ncbi:hypothetical protein J6590_030618 [Homalodisca vitripennis]|nr:hypothetical protein J6590_030618 [Homalodisca vitripennis]